MSRAESLYRLQLLDLELDRARKRLGEIEALLAGSPALEHTRAEAAKAEKALRLASAELKSLELDAQSLDDKIAGEEQRLYSGAIRSPKEMLDLQQELDALKRRRVVLDDQLLAAMEQVEQLRADELRCRQALAQAERNFADDSVHLRAEREKLQAAIEGDLEQREALCRSIPSRDLDLYSAIRAKKTNGVAVALIKTGACSQCGETPSSQLIQQAHTGAALAICSNCGRILYAQ
ncbi:MAG: zinc ribbon domain-containing protein [Candidatus Brachytrichaceae bacterium NZ_4S206]|jgi:predicted  nucleic acid-binding Zn-ribbon protein